MSESSPTLSSSPTPDDLVESVARRALGAALSQMWGTTPSGPELPAPSCDPEVARRAIALLQSRVPPGPELDLAVRLLDETSSSDR